MSQRLLEQRHNGHSRNLKEVFLLTSTYGCNNLRKIPGEIIIFPVVSRAGGMKIFRGIGNHTYR